MELNNNTISANSYYDGYDFTPSSPNAWDHISDLFLGTNNVQNKNQNNLNWNMMKEQNKFTEYMSSTSYQRAVADMEKAGINPMLAALNGGASSASSASVSQNASQTVASTLHKKQKEMTDKISNMIIKLASILL